jgi:glycogen debranching enzyme
MNTDVSVNGGQGPGATGAGPGPPSDAWQRPVVEPEDVTLLEGTTFCLSAANGDIQPDRPHGLFFRDSRVISLWELRIDGEIPHLLSAQQDDEPFTGRFIARRPPAPGQADSTLLIVRDRLVASALWETITLENHSSRAATVTVTLRAGADFADLFAVKDGRALNSQAPRGPVRGVGVVRPHGLLLRDPQGTERSVLITATRDPSVTPDLLTWRLLIPPRGRWSAEVSAQPATEPGGPAHWPAHPGRQRPSPGDQRRAEEMAREITSQPQATTIESEDPLLDQVLQQTSRDLAALRITGTSQPGTPFIAAGAPWFMTLFGRDSLITAWMALPLDAGLALGTLQLLASCQGRRSDPVTEEEPGRILHELRRGPGEPGAAGLGHGHYYGTVDATPLFVLLLAEACRWGASTEAVAELLPAADMALEWAASYGDRDGDLFVEYQRSSGRGLANQGWKDSDDSINFADGSLAEAPIALCEVQAYVYAALRARAELAAAFGDPQTAARCRQRAAELREAFLDKFWLPGKGWYAVALDRNKRPVDALTSNVAHCLWTGIAPDEHAGALIARLADEDMDTGFGLRTLAASMGAYNPMSYHNGSVWPHDTAIAVAGLLRYAHLPGAAELATRLASGLLAATAGLGYRPPELFCGFARDEFSPPVPYPTACSPQAWASAAPLLLLRAFCGLDPDVPGRRVKLAPRLPQSWGTVTLSGLRLGPARLTVSARGGRGNVEGLPGGWAVDGVSG